jgi:hypothetical protein
LAIATSICLSSVTICSALYFLIDISSFLLREILSHFSWFKKGRSGQLACPRKTSPNRKRENRGIQVCLKGAASRHRRMKPNAHGLHYLEHGGETGVAIM